MSRYNHKKKLTAKDIFYRFLAASIAIATIVYFLPREGRSQYQFDLGRPWRYSQLIATFDFPIYKSSRVIQHEMDSLTRLYEPYFEMNTHTEEEQLKRFREQYQKKLKGTLPAHYVQNIEKRLHLIYNRGVLDNEDYNRLLKDSTANIRIFANNEAQQRPTNQVFSHKSAYKFLTQETDTIQAYRFALQQCNLNEFITPNLKFDEAKSKQQLQEKKEAISYANGMVLSGQKIIDKGEIVDEYKYNILLSFEKEAAKRTDNTSQSLLLLLGQILYVTSITVSLLLYFNLFRRDYMESARSILLLITMSAVFPLLTAAMVRHNWLNVYLLPYSMAPIFIRVFMDSRTAFITHAATIMLCAISLKYPFEFVATQMVAGLAAIYSLRELSQRSQLLKTALFATLTALTFYLSLDLMHEHTLANINSSTYLYIAISGVLLLFAYPVMFLIEKIFGFTSNVTLVELSNINNVIMRTMSEVAPGTFQHSMQVANLAAEVANRIGAKSQLVRTGALYHDIGKTANPAFFTENQSGVNPHENLSYVESARIIINHVRDGVALAEKHNLPPIIKDFITTHHGTSMAKYFYISYQNKFPEENIDKKLFTYPGPDPQTLEQAILMMADAVEAASRSLQEYTEESISNLVDKLIDIQVQEGHFRNCPLTFHDISEAKEVFKEKLKIIYHTRISYPELNTQNNNSGYTGSTSK